MLNGATLSAAAMVGTAVFRMVVSSASIKKATATSHGNSRLLEGLGDGAPGERGGLMRYEARRQEAFVIMVTGTEGPHTSGTIGPMKIFLLAAALCLTGCTIERPGPVQHDSQTVDRDNSESVRVNLDMGAGTLRV